MTAELSALCFDAQDPALLARFWAGVLGWSTDGDEVTPSDGTVFRLRFLANDEPKTVQNQMHFDLTSASPDQQRETVERALELGGRHIDIGQRSEEGHIVLADPEGNEFCVIEAGNNFLANTGFLGCVSSNGTYAVGMFWRDALGWPLVWDEGEETAIQQPRGGSKISWGGRPFPAKTAKNRVHFDLVVDDAERDAELDRLVSLGATVIEATHHLPAATAMADPDGNEFCVVAR